MNITDKSNTCIIGVGDAGSNITIDVLSDIKSDYLLLRNHAINKDHRDNNIEIKASSNINPSTDLIRRAFFDLKDEILATIDKYDSLVIIGNLASKFGSAILPVLTQALKKEMVKEVICFVILPFGFEREKIFRCGVSLSFLTKYVDSLIVIDNNAFLTNNHDISIKECYKVTNTAIKDIIIRSLNKNFPDKFNLMASANSNTKSIKDAFIRSMAILTESINPSYIQKCSIYVYNSFEKISTINSIMKTTSNLIEGSDHQVDIISEGNELARCHILLETNRDIISWYDPLNHLIPTSNILDFEPEVSVNNNQLSHFKNIESYLTFDN